MRAFMVAIIMLAAVPGTWAQWPARPVEAPTAVDAQLAARHQELVESEDASQLREAAERERREYSEAVDSGPGVSEVSARIGLVAKDYRNARLARNRKAKEASRGEGGTSAIAAELRELDQNIAQLQTTLRGLLEERRQAVRANRAAMVDKKQSAEAAEAAYRDHVYGDAEIRGLMEEKLETEASRAAATD